jgi:hypothetical protein
MPRYFFHVHSAKGITRDQVGQEFPGVEAARAEALKALQNLPEAKAEKVAEASLLIEIADQTGNTVANVPLPAGARYPSGRELEGEDNDLA